MKSTIFVKEQKDVLHGDSDASTSVSTAVRKQDL